MADPILKNLTSNVAIESMPVINPRQTVTGEFANAINNGFKLGINGNYGLIKSQNEVIVDVLNGSETTGKAMLCGVFNNTNDSDSPVAYSVDFGLVDTLLLDDIAWWDKFLKDSLIFVNTTASDGSNYIILNCNFTTQNETNPITYTVNEKAVTLTLYNSTDTLYSTTNLLGHIIPIKIHTGTIVEDSVSYNANTTVDVVQAQLNLLRSDITDLKGDMTLLDVNFAGKVDKTQTIAGINLQNNITDTALRTALAINNNENTSDIDKPVSTAQAEAIAQAITDLKGGATTYDTLKKITDLIGVANGIAPLGADSKIASTYLPSYVDDILEYDDLASFPATGETGKIYVAKDTNLTYRWSGTTYVEISKSLAIGILSSTAFQGDYGKELYDFAQTAIAGGLLKAQLDSKLAITDKYTAPIAVRYFAMSDLNYPPNDVSFWDYDYVDGDNAIIEINTTYPKTKISITNVTAGDIGVVTVKGGQLTLPLNSILSADYGYLTAVGNQYYRYSFYFDGTNFEWHRTVLGNE